jgi:GntR family transcriptional regulator
VTREVLTQSISFQLDTSSGVPAYLQVVEQVTQALRMGTLEVGDQLPTVKQVVAQVAVNPNTVLKAYRELERDGLVEGRQGLGTFVRRVPTGPPPGTQARLARSLQRWITLARAEGLDDEAIEALLRAALRVRSEQVVA